MSPGSPRFDEAADPVHQLEAAVASAAEQDKVVLVEVGGDWCPSTRSLDELIASDPAVKHLMAERFVHVRVHVARNQPHSELVGSFPGLDEFPQLLFFDDHGRVLGQENAAPWEIDGTTRHEPDKVLAVLRNYQQG